MAEDGLGEGRGFRELGVDAGVGLRRHAQVLGRGITCGPAGFSVEATVSHRHWSEASGENQSLPGSRFPSRSCNV